MSNEAFAPEDLSTKVLAYNTGSLRVQLAHVTYAGCVRVFNDGAQKAFIRFGIDNTVVAATTDLPIGPGSTEVFKVTGPMAYVAAISATGAGNLYVTQGEGV